MKNQKYLHHIKVHFSVPINYNEVIVQKEAKTFAFIHSMNWS